MFSYAELEVLHQALRAAREAFESVEWFTSGLTPDTSTGGADLIEANNYAQLLRLAAVRIEEETARLVK